MKCYGSAGEPADSYYRVKSDSTDLPKSKFRIKAGKTLSVRKWQAAFSSEGYLDIGKILGRIRNGGIHPQIKGEVWEFLLGCYDPHSTFEERAQIRQKRRVQYAQWKGICRQMFPLIGSGKYITAPVITEKGEPIQDPLVILEANIGNGDPADTTASGGNRAPILENEKETNNKIIQWKLTLHQIGLDVKRTDRILVFYEKQENLAKLWDILAIYSWIDEDVGYCQGMSDLCSPMIIVLDNEADAFCCFERLMRRLRGNFRCNGNTVGVEAQLMTLASVTQVIEPKLHQHLDRLGGGDYLFAIRMLMVLFRREFSFCDSLYLWEMMWALDYDPTLYSIYEQLGRSGDKEEKTKSFRQYGKYKRAILKNGAEDHNLSITIFLVTSVLKQKSLKLLTEARGLDDIVKILNELTGTLDAKKACIGAMKLHKKYLKKLRIKFYKLPNSSTENHTAATETEDKVEGGLLLNIVVGESTAILELLPGKDETLLVRGNALLVLNLSLDIINGVRAFNLQGDSLASQGLNKDLHPTTQAKHKMKGGLLLNGSSILKLLSGEDEPLLVRRDSFLVLDLSLDIINGVRALNFQGDRLPSEGLHEDLHATTEPEDQGSSVFKLLPGEDEPLLVRWDPFLVLDLSLDIINGVRALNFQGDRLPGEGLHEDLHATTEPEHQVES
ncbi:hypothetical protein V2J09_002445 [Rumex salicifolius]